MRGANPRPSKCDSCSLATAADCDWLGRNVKEGRVLEEKVLKLTGKTTYTVNRVKECRYHREGSLPPIGRGIVR
jgi:hypothetical protein